MYFDLFFALAAFFVDICALHFFEKPLLDSLLCFVIISALTRKNKHVYFASIVLLVIEKFIVCGNLVNPICATAVQVGYLIPASKILNNGCQRVYYGLLLTACCLGSGIGHVAHAGGDTYTMARIGANIGIMVIYLKYMQFKGRLGDRL